MGFFIVFDRIVPAQNKYMATLWNDAPGRKVIVEKILRCNWQVAAVTGVLLEQELRTITDLTTPGANVPIGREDGSVALTLGISADTGSAGVTEAANGLVKRFFSASEEITLATFPPFESADAQTIWWRRPGSSGLVGRQGQGITIKNITNSTVGSVSYIFEFRDEADV